MNKKIILLVCLVFVVATFLLIRNYYPDSVHRTKDTKQMIDSNIVYKQAIESIHQKVIDLTVPSDLFLCDTFIYIYENSNYYLHDAIDFISDKSNDLEDRYIALYSMYNLDVDIYVEFVDSLYFLYTRNVVNESFLKDAIFYPFTDNKPVMVKNYRKKNVRSVLENIQRDSTISENFGNSISRVLNGSDHD